MAIVTRDKNYLFIKSETHLIDGDAIECGRAKTSDEIYIRSHDGRIADDNAQIAYMSKEDAIALANHILKLVE